MPIPYIPTAEEVATTVASTVATWGLVFVASTILAGSFIYVVGGVYEIKKTLARIEKKKEE